MESLCKQNYKGSKEIIQIQISPILSQQYQLFYFYKQVKMFSYQMAKIVSIIQVLVFLCIN